MFFFSLTCGPGDFYTGPCASPEFLQMLQSKQVSGWCSDVKQFYPTLFLLDSSSLAPRLHRYHTQMSEVWGYFLLSAWTQSETFPMKAGNFFVNAAYSVVRLAGKTKTTQ